MNAQAVRLIALLLVLGAVLCVGVMFASGLGIMWDLWRAGDLQFAAMVARIRELRAWGYAGIGLFVVAFVLLWMTPGSRGSDTGPITTSDAALSHVSQSQDLPEST